MLLFTKFHPTTLPYAHEAPIYNPDADEVFLASNAGSGSDIDNNNRVMKIIMNLKEVEEKIADLQPGDAVNVTVTKVCSLVPVTL